MYLLLAVIALFVFVIFWKKDSKEEILTVTKSQNDTVDFPNFSGEILIKDFDPGAGSTTIWLVGGDVATLIGCSGGCADLGNPASGLIEFNSDINGYTWRQSKFAEPTTYSFITRRISNNA